MATQPQNAPGVRQRRGKNGGRPSCTEQRPTENESGMGPDVPKGSGNGSSIAYTAAHKRSGRESSEARKGNTEPKRCRRDGRAGNRRAEKQELKSIQPKLPLNTQPLKDHGDVVNAIRELDEKRNGKTKEL